MRLVPFFLLLLLLSNCKKQERLDPTPPVAAEPALPRGILDFKVRGVPKENIRFITLGSVNGEVTNRHGVISLPADYPYGDTIRIVAKIPKGYKLLGPRNNELDPAGFSIAYQGASVGFFAVDSLGGHNQIELYIDPAAPIAVSPVGKAYTYTIEGDDDYPSMKVQNWGTFQTLTKKPNGLDSLVNGYSEFKNVKTGAVTIGSVGGYQPGDGGMYMGVPTTLTAGEYEVTLVRHNRRAVVPDRLILSYGLPKVTGSSFFKEAFNQEDNALSYDGFNLLGHRYELELSSFFFPKRRFPLDPVSHLRIATKLPMELTPGTYKAILYLDGKALPYKNPLTGQALALIRKDYQQPALSVLTQLSRNADTSSGFTIYEPASSLKRSEPVLAFFQCAALKPGQAFSIVTRLLFKNVETGAEYALPQTGYTSGMLPYPIYKSPSELPAGKYQVRFGIRYSPEGVEYVSGLYYQEIEVE